MAGASREEVFDISADKYFQALVDYNHYPELLSEVNNIDVLENSEDGALIRYNIQVVKTVSYILKMKHQRPHRLEWHLDSGSIFKTNSGSWEIEPIGPAKCKVRYNLDVSLKIFAPKAITNKLVAVNLPRMMRSFYEHAKTLN